METMGVKEIVLQKKEHAWDEQVSARFTTSLNQTTIRQLFNGTVYAEGCRVYVLTDGNKTFYARSRRSEDAMKAISRNEGIDPTKMDVGVMTLGRFNGNLKFYDLIFPKRPKTGGNRIFLPNFDSSLIKDAIQVKWPGQIKQAFVKQDGNGMAIEVV
jgi:hypothetical protein